MNKMTFYQHISHDPVAMMIDLYHACLAECRCRDPQEECNPSDGSCHSGCAPGWVGAACHIGTACMPPTSIPLSLPKYIYLSLYVVTVVDPGGITPELHKNQHMKIKSTIVYKSHIYVIITAFYCTT